jgi:hypothetical protein
MKTSFVNGLPSQQQAHKIIDDELMLLQGALATDELLKKFPAKTYQSGFSNQMMVNAEKALSDICSILAASDADLQKEQSKLALKQAVIHALSPHMFPRTI